MTGLDTNVLIRYLVEDDADQAARAAALIEKAVQQGEKLFVASIVLCEVVWVLSVAYHRPRSDIVRTLGAILLTAQFVIQDLDLAHRALASYAQGPADFADYLVAEQALRAGCETLATFDKKLLRDDRFVEPCL
ncbi:MAG: type II toxin-antitoxin system VapC family toxin [Deltaproteobacteria bacterium]|nr:type II toxin-antitoxin system VapC family toxin [Deltaproteobacteria bacterium]